MTVEEQDPAARVNSDERETLILAHMGQVRSIARRIQERLPQHVSADDLISVGVIGLIQAIDNYDPSFNTKLSTYAEYKIRGAILDGLRTEDWVPRLNRKRSKTIEAAIVSAQQKLQRVPSEEDVAKELDIPVEQYREWLSDLHGLEILSASKPLDANSRATLMYYVAGEDALPSTMVEQREMEEILAQELTALPEMERVVLSLYYQSELSPQEISRVVGIKATRVSQIRCQAIVRLRASFARRFAAGGKGSPA